MNRVKIMNKELYVLRKDYLSKYTDPKSEKTTDRAKATDLHNFITWMSKRLDRSPVYSDWTHALTCSYRDELLKDYSPSSVTRYLAHIKHWDKKIAQHYGTPQVTQDVKNPYVPKSAPKAVSREGLASIRKAIPKICRNEIQKATVAFCFEIYINTSLRISEPLRVSMSQLDLNARLIRRVKCKGSKYRDIYIPTSLDKHIEEYQRIRLHALRERFHRRGLDWDALSESEQEEYPWLVSTRKSKPGEPKSFRVSISTISRNLSNAGEDAGLHFHAHKARHTRIKTLVDEGKIKVAQSVAGHEDVRTTLDYAEPDSSEVIEAVEENIL